MTTPLHPAGAAATPPRSSPRSLEDVSRVTEGRGDSRHHPDNVTSRRRNVSSSKRISARTETNNPGERIDAGNRATVAGMLGSSAPLAETATLSAHAAERHRHRPKTELYYLLIGDAIELPMLPQTGGWVTTTRTAQPSTRERAPRRALY